MPNESFYRTKAWHRIRTKVLIRDGFRCRTCGKDVSEKGAAAVDHIIPRRARPDLELEMSNLQTLCRLHHDSTKARDENNPDRGCHEDGTPRDPSHHWNK